jgi:hypothetical protein
MGFAFDAIAAQLRDPSDGIFRDIAWLEESWANPETFGTALLRFLETLDRTPIKSTPTNGYDFYHDLVLRHVNTDRVALYWLDHEQRPVRLTYAQLHALCTRRRAEWNVWGVQTRQQLCVIADLYPDPSELLVPLLTGLRMGLQVSLLPPSGIDFLKRRLKALAPKWVATAARYLPLLRGTEWEPCVINIQPGLPLMVDTADSTSHTYEKKSVAFQLFSPLHEPVDVPIKLLASDAYHGALRDSLLLLGLHPGQVVAVAEQSLLQFQPALLLATMMRGATLLPLKSSVFEGGVRDSPLNRLPPISILFVNATLRDVMMESAPQPLAASLRLWIRNPQENPDPNAWSDWARRWNLQGTPSMSLLIDSACGGSILFSLRRLGYPQAWVMPAPGRPFELQQPDDSGEPARGPFGVFTPAPTSIGILLSKLDAGYIYTGTRAPTEAGHVYPKDEVEAAVQDLPFVQGASVVKEPNEGRSTLLIFTGPETQHYARHYLLRRQQILREEITRRLAPDFLPARMIITSQLPRVMDGGGIDHLWCTQMLMTGELRKRASNPVFALLDRLLQASMPTLRNKS